MLKIEDLRVGDEVECVSSFHVEIKEKDLLEVTGVNERSLSFMSIKNGNKYTFNKSYMGCFKKIEKYTFDDLIDMAVQARKDKLIGSISICEKYIAFEHGDHALWYGANRYQDGIDFIQSLYKETFVIEDYEDIKRIKNNANITLSNGNRIEQAVLENQGDYVVFNDSADNFYTFGFIVLKGAKVEQSKG